MSIIKSFSVGNGDMFYIKHDSDNFTIIDCNIVDDNKDKIINDIKEKIENKNIVRFISTHPDKDHITGIKFLFDTIKIPNFYCVKNKVDKDKNLEDFKKYYELRDKKLTFYLEKDCARKWMNKSDNNRNSSGIFILWPDLNNEEFLEELKAANNGEKFNNISPIINFKIENGISVLWFGDLETEFMEKIKNKVKLPKADIIFAPHHGRKSGKLPKEWLEQMEPTLLVIGEAKSKDLNYPYSEKYNTITQNSANDISFICREKYIYVCVSNPSYKMTIKENEELIEIIKDKKCKYGNIICKITVQGN